MTKPRFIFAAGLTVFCASCVLADAATGPDKTLYEDSIQTTKQSIADETLSVFYQEALDDYHDGRYDEAMQTLDKIYSINPHYQDVESLRATIIKKQKSAASEQNMGSIHDLMKKGDAELRLGQRVVAVNYWKQALDLDPDYAPAKKKIQEVNQAMAKKEFETGYIHYHNGELEDALDSWSNAVALDPTYKQRGLLLLMSKTEIQVKNDRINRLNAQAFDQYSQGMLEDALHSYDELSTLEPRHEEARRMRAKIKVQLGQAAYKAAQTAMDHHDYTEAGTQADKAIFYNYEIASAQALKIAADTASKRVAKTAASHHPSHPTANLPASSTATATLPGGAPVSTQPANPEEAQIHYRKALGAMRTKDFNLALQELDIATQLDPTDEHIYMARQRAQQERSATSGGAGAGGGGTP